ERGGQVFGDIEQTDHHPASRWRSRIVSQPLLPAETIPHALCAVEDRVRDGWRSGGRWRQAHLQAKVSHELQAGTPMCSAARVAPEQRGNTNRERMQEHAHHVNAYGEILVVPGRALMRICQGLCRGRRIEESTKRQVGGLW